MAIKRSRAAISRRRKKYVLSHPNKTNRELAEELGLCRETIIAYRRGTEYRYAVGAGQSTKKWTVKVSQRLDAAGIPNKPLPDVYKIELDDGSRAKVCYCNRPYVQLGYPSLLFHVKKGSADFFLLVAGDTDKIYVVPDSAANNANVIKIPTMPYEDKRKKRISKYEQYLNNFNLLRQ